MYIPRVDPNYTPKSKRYYMIRPQLSTSVLPDTRSDRYDFPGMSKRGFWRGMVGLSVFAACMYLLLYIGAFDFLRGF